MKTLSFKTLSLIDLLDRLMSTVTTLPHTQKTVVNPATSWDSTSAASTQITAYTLVQKVYQGDYIWQGIPSGSALVTAHRKGWISARLLVKRAVKAKRLPKSVLTDERYLKAVENSFLLHYLLHPAKRSSLCQQEDCTLASGQEGIAHYPNRMLGEHSSLQPTSSQEQVRQNYLLERRWIL